MAATKSSVDLLIRHPGLKTVLIVGWPTAVAIIAQRVRVDRLGRFGATGQMVWGEVVHKPLTFW